MSGSIAGTVSSHNRAGQYKRNRRAPVQPIGTGRRAQVRGAFSAASSAFSALTTAQQDAFTSFAASHPITDSLGQSIVLTGHQMFVRIAASLLNVGQALPTAPPASTSPPSIMPVTFAFSVATGIAVGWTAGGATQFVTTAYSMPVSSGVRFFKTFWQPAAGSGHWPATPGAATLTTANYGAQFGAPAIGRRVFAKLTPIDVGGFNGPGIIVSTVVVA